MLSPSQHHLAAPGIAWPRANLAKFKPGNHAHVARIHGRGRAPGGAMGPRDKPEGDGGGGELRRASTRRSESPPRSDEHTSELPSLMSISYAVFSLKKKRQKRQ